MRSAAKPVNKRIYNILSFLACTFTGESVYIYGGVRVHLRGSPYTFTGESLNCIFFNTIQF